MNKKGENPFNQVRDECALVAIGKQKDEFPLSELKASHAAVRTHNPQYIQSLYTLSFEELINKLFIEIHAKNQAYIFILGNDNGLCEAFMQYSGLIKLSDKIVTDLDFYSKGKEQLINDFFFNMHAKNQAYYFILEHGHFNSFSNYCQ